MLLPNQRLPPPSSAAKLSSFHVLVVCTGNICRSPAAELLLRRGLDQRWGQLGADAVTVGSAGLGCYDGWPVDPPVAELLQELDVNGWKAFRSRTLTDSLVTAADLILTATRGHRFRIGEQWPAAYRRAFALGEAAELLRQLDLAALPTSSDDRNRALVDWLADERGVRQIADNYDLADPYGRRTADYREMMQRVVPMTQVIVDAMAPAPPE